MKYLLYTGTANKRTMTASQWREVGIEGQDTVVFEVSNDYCLPADHFTDAALQILYTDPGIMNFEAADEMERRETIAGARNARQHEMRDMLDRALVAVDERDAAGISDPSTAPVVAGVVADPTADHE